MSLVGCSASGRDMAIVKCFDELVTAGRVPAAKDVKLDLHVAAESSGYVVTGVVYATTFSEGLAPLNVTCHVESSGDVVTATASP